MLTIINIPTYQQLITQSDGTTTTSSTQFAQGLAGDFLPWLGLFVVITIAALALAALARRIVSGSKRIFGGRRRGFRRRR